MHCIVSISGMEETVSMHGSRIPKPMLLIGDTPIAATLFRGLRDLQEFFERIYIAGSGLKPYEDWLKFCLHDDFFKTKVTFLKVQDSQGLGDDAWRAVEWLSERKKLPSSLAVIRPDVFWKDVSFLTDESLGSFRVYASGSPLDCWRFDSFVDLVNAMAFLEDKGIKSMEALSEKLSERGDLPAFDASSFMMPTGTQRERLLAAKWAAEQERGGEYAVDVDLDRQTVKLSNAWKAKRWTPAVHLSERAAQSRLWDCWDFLDSACSWQKPYLQQPVSRGPNVRGQYCNWIELQWIPDSSVEAMMMHRPMSEQEWRSIMDKALDILEEKFWLEQERDWRSDADKKDRTRFVEEREEYWQDIVKAKVPQFSRIKWETILSRHVEWLESHVRDRKAVFHNGTGGRMVHGSLSLKNIRCNWQSLDIRFINPSCRTGVLVDSLSEYAPMYADCWCLLPVFRTGRHVDCGPEGLDVPDFLADNAAAIEGILDARLGDAAKEAKTEALMLALDSIEDVPADYRKTMLAFLHYRADELYTGASDIVRRKVQHECIGRERGFEECPNPKRDMRCIREMPRREPHSPFHPHPHPMPFPKP